MLDAFFDFLFRNCNHFTNALCNQLLGKGIPSWVNRTAKIGAAMKSNFHLLAQLCCLESTIINSKARLQRLLDQVWYLNKKLPSFLQARPPLLYPLLHLLWLLRVSQGSLYQFVDLDNMFCLNESSNHTVTPLPVHVATHLVVRLLVYLKHNHLRGSPRKKW